MIIADRTSRPAAATRRFRRPRHFRRFRIVVIGCGDVGQRIARRLSGRARIIGIARSSATLDQIRAVGALPVAADSKRLNAARSKRLVRAADAVLYSAPPSNDAAGTDTEARRWAHVISGRRLVYISTTGVYDHALDLGDRFVDECAPTLRDSLADREPKARANAEVRALPIAGELALADVQALALGRARGLRRLDAERTLRRRAGAVVLRAPGIYAQDRLPLERLRRGLPVLCREDDHWSNHVHADDLASMVIAGLFRGHATRVYNAVDDDPLPSADWFEALADWSGLPRPTRVDRATHAAALTPMARSFALGSRRISNARMHRELRVRLRHPSVRSFLRTTPRAGA